MPLHPAEDRSFVDQEPDEFAFWPMDLVLLLMGATVLAVAFYYLDPSDTRLHRNPWTFVVVTPLILGVMSIALRTIVSRIVEKSMQMAFLLSVLVHLFLLIGAMNVVIFSRMWPDILESLAKERHQLKREMLQANQYHRLTSSSQTGSRPDYMQHQPTVHQPTEMEAAKSPSLALARSNVNNLVSPVPEIERRLNPHLIERQQPSPATSNPSEAAASLSRSDLSRRMESQAVPQRNQLEQMREPMPLRASEQATNRRQSRTPALQQDTSQSPAESPELTPTTTMMRRAETRPVELEQPLRPSPERQMTRNRQPQSQPIRTPNAPAASRVEMAELQPAVESQRSRRRADERLPMQEPALNEMAQQLQSLMQPSATRAQRREAQLQVPRPASGQSSAMPRSTAGGAAGPPAASSMPIQGAESYAAQENGPNEVVSPQLAARRRSDRGRTPASLPSSMGAPSAPQWTREPSLSGGVSGRSPLEVAQSDTPNGSAASSDSANMQGAGRDLQRASAGLPGRAGEVTLPSGSTGSAADAAPSQVASNDAGVARRRSTGRSSNVQFDLPNPSDVAGAGTPSSSNLAASVPRATDGMVTPSAASSGRPSQAMSRAEAVGGRPNALNRGDISVPQVATTQGEESGSDFTGGSGTARRRSSASTNLLALDAPEGVGGISPRVDLAGDLLPRRSTAPRRENNPVDLEIQRFSRQNVGGRIAAGQISIPRPAFEQRMERLRDRDPLEQTSMEPETELAIERGLAFLAKHQREDGSWRLQDFDTKVLMTSDTAATGLALLAFQGAGYTHKEFKYAEVVNKAIEFLKKNQVRDGEYPGDLYIKQDPASDQNAWLYSHGIAALALSEAYGMTQDPELKPAAQAAIDFMVLSQDKDRGGWRYRPGTGSDTSVSGWFMMAYKSAELAGLKVPSESYERLDEYLVLSQAEDAPHLFRYNPYAQDTKQQRHGLKPTPVMTSVGLLMRLYTGWKRDSSGVVRGTDYLMEHLPDHGTQRKSLRDTYYWYYATQVMFHMGGEKWETWHDRLYPLLIESQVKSGDNEGSWEPNTPTPDLWVRYGGRLYVTTMNLLSLEVSYRHLPLYDATGAPTE